MYSREIRIHSSLQVSISQRYFYRLFLCYLRRRVNIRGGDVVSIYSPYVVVLIEKNAYGIPHISIPLYIFENDHHICFFSPF